MLGRDIEKQHIDATLQAEGSMESKSCSKQNVLELNFEGVCFKKMSKFRLLFLAISVLGRPAGPQGGTGSKSCISLGLNFSGGQFYEKIPKSKIFVAWPASPALRPCTGSGVGQIKKFHKTKVS